MEKRYDRDVLGKLNDDYDIVCPKCCSAIGFPCTRPIRDGHVQLKEIHEERRNVVYQTES